MEQNIIGRKTEIQKLKKYISTPRSEFIAIYGRRRVGKTYLIKELFENSFTFRVTGKENVSTEEQLRNFYFALNPNEIEKESNINSWDEAFGLLRQRIDSMGEGMKLLFFDELPWFDTRGSQFISALEHFWNDWAFYRNDIKLVVCGSATTWMLDKVINSRGGLHNRVTHKILLSPFKLNEVEEYFNANGFSYARQEIIEAYMAVGGVAYYLSLFDSDKSVAGNIESLCFTRGGDLDGEFPRLYKSLFKKSENYISVITALYQKGKGMTRLEIVKNTNLASNGNLSKILRNLCECEFIREYVPFGKKKKDTMYQLIDPFTLFYLHFMREGGDFLSGYWQKMQSTSEYKIWCGHAFEMVCLNHIEQIVHALGIDGTINRPCSWTYTPPKDIKDDEDEDLKHGAQIDLLIDRSDRTITICEIKYSAGEYDIDKQYNSILEQRVRTFRKVSKTTKSINTTFITPNGLTDNMYSRRIPRQVVGDDLFGTV